MQKRTWSEEQLRKAVKEAKSLRRVLSLLGLRPAGGNYTQIKKYLAEYNLDTSHFTGKSWNKGMHFPFRPKVQLEDILKKNSHFQSFKLKKRLFQAKLKKPMCEKCGWAEKSVGGYLPLELDHINGDSTDNRIENLQVLCPNCHSLQPTHRGRNKKKKIDKITPRW